MPLPFYLAIPAYAALSAYIAGKTWTIGRFVLNGFDYEATMETLKKDKSLYIDDLWRAISSLARAKDFDEVARGTAALMRIHASLPEETKNGLNKTMNLDAFIEATVKQSLYRAALPLVGAKRAKDETAETYAKRILSGLVLVGRSQRRLSDKQRSEAVLSLLSALEELPKEKVLKGVLQTWQPTEPVTLITALEEGTLMKQVARHAEDTFATLYVVYALGSDMTINDPASLVSELLAYATETV